MNSNEKGIIGEDFVNEIAYDSFIKYWCYPSPRDEDGDKKEICDLLILFRDNAIIISVKNYEFKENYTRYFRRTNEKAIKQIYGAERKLLFSKRDIYIKHPNKNKEKFPKENINKVYRIIVNLGEGVKFYPFNKETKDEKFISLFDKEAFKTIIKELDTLPDFIEYLQKREDLFFDKTVTILPEEEYDFPSETSAQFFEYEQSNFISENKKGIILSGTENDLLAHYLKHNRSFSEQLASNKYDGMFIQLDGNWEDYLSKREVILKKQYDINSYFIDELVKREVLSDLKPNSEELAIELLSFNRFDRRVISNNFLQFYDDYKKNRGLSFARRYGDFNGTGIVFAFYTAEMDNEMVNKFLELTLESFCVYSNYKSNKMILIATTREFRQFKMGVMKDIKPFSRDKELLVKEDIKKLGWFTAVEEIRQSEKEYPDE